MLNEAVGRFERRAPVSVMARVALGHALPAQRYGAPEISGAVQP
jgi:hypothetical protein